MRVVNVRYLQDTTQVVILEFDSREAIILNAYLEVQTETIYTFYEDMRKTLGLVGIGCSPDYRVCELIVTPVIRAELGVAKEDVERLILETAQKCIARYKESL